MSDTDNFITILNKELPRKLKKEAALLTDVELTHIGSVGKVFNSDQYLAQIKIFASGKYFSETIFLRPEEVWNTDDPTKVRDKYVRVHSSLNSFDNRTKMRNFGRSILANVFGLNE